MVFSEEDKALIKNLYLLKGYGARRLMTEFPLKTWNRGALNSLLLKLRKTGSTNLLYVFYMTVFAIFPLILVLLGKGATR